MTEYKINSTDELPSCAPLNPPFKFSDEQLREKISCVSSAISKINQFRTGYIKLAGKLESKKRGGELSEDEQGDYDDILEYLLDTQLVLDDLELYLGDCETEQENRDGGSIASIDEGKKKTDKDTLKLASALSSDKTLDLRLKSPTDWTEDELKDAMKAREAASNDAEKREMFNREREWFEANYGSGEVGFDETGRMVQPKPVRPISTTPVPVRTKDGQDLEDAMKEVLDKLQAGGEAGGDVSIAPVGEPQSIGSVNGEKVDLPQQGAASQMPLASGNDMKLVQGIQSGLNMLSNKKNQSPLPGKPMTVKLKEDGIAGPKTGFGLKKALVNNGASKVSEAIALGQFKDTVKKAKAAGPQNLAAELGATFAPLLGSKKMPKVGFQPEGLALQDTLNDLGASKKGYEPLKDDGIVGPKTEAAFDLVAKLTDEDELVNQFGYNLGFDF